MDRDIPHFGAGQLADSRRRYSGFDWGMRGIRLHGDRDARLEEIAAPSGIGAIEVLIAPLWVGICGTDLYHYLHGAATPEQEPHPLTGAAAPQIMGHEFSARVVDIGESVENVDIGDLVSVMPILSCGACEYCLRGVILLCPLMACMGLSTRWGGLAELAVLESRQVWRAPEGMTEQQAALVEPAAAAMHAISRGGVRAGDRVLITGGGPMGALCALAARAAGATEVYLSEPSRVRREQLGVIDLDLVMDPGLLDVATEIRSATGGLGADVVIECSGVESGLQTAMQAARARGVVVLLGIHSSQPRFDAHDAAARELTVLGTWGYDAYAWPRYMSMVHSGVFPVELIVTRRIGLDEVISDGFERLVSSEVDEMKILVEVGDGVRRRGGEA